jgi:hypothetical protein
MTIPLAPCSGAHSGAGGVGAKPVT